MCEEVKGKCLICGEERDYLEKNRWFPFCSEQCLMVDLYSWLNEDYYIEEN